MDVKTTSASAILLVLVILSTVAILRIINKTDTIYGENLHTPDASIQKFSSEQFNDKGDLNQVIQAKKLVHYSIDDSAKFDGLNVELFNDNGDLDWRALAQGGSSQHGMDIVGLWGNVQFYHPGSSNSKETTIITDRAEVYLQKKYFETDVPVTFKQPSLVAQAIGANFDFNTKVINLLKNVQETYNPIQNGKNSGSLLLNPTDANEPVYIEANSVQHDYAAKISTYLGIVKFSQGSTLLKADKAIAYNDQKNNKVTKIITFGNPSTYQGFQGTNSLKHQLKASANSMEYYPADERIVLLGNGQILQNGTKINASYIVYDLRGKILRTVSNKKNYTKIVIKP